MGVPTFFRWLTLRCPKLLQDAYEDDDDELYTDFLNNEEEANKNPLIDNLYLDMNGLIHPCTHPENKNIPEPTCENDMFNNIFMYVDKIVSIVKPQKLLYLAIDGCAPRAKMNQQRGRRFKAASESAKTLEKKKELKQLFLQKGIKPEVLENFDKQRFDHNVITPGTPFMERMTNSIKEFIYSRLNNHPLYKDLIIILSDSNSPGEGEHKILEFIRKQRNSQDYNPNTKHCIYGADADLIMLGLSTHEPYFYILRETIIPPSEKQCTLCGKSGHFFEECDQNTENQIKEQKPTKNMAINFQFVKLFVLREFLHSDFVDISLNFEYNLERICDDFVFLCFFVGNDFLPHFPSLTIRNGGIDCLLFIYKNLLPTFNGYITENGNIDLLKIEKFFEYLSKVEPALLEQQRLRQELDKKRQQQEQQRQQYQQKQQLAQSSGISSNKLAALQFKQQFSTDSNISANPAPEPEKKELVLENEYLEGNLEENFKLKLKSIIDQEKQQESKEYYKGLNETIASYGDKGFKQRYYKEKFAVDPANFFEFQKSVTQAYIEGLCWNYAYYYKGCVSWNWFYPYHYAPFASDLKGIANIQVNLEKGEPFQPFQQLLAVLSPLSSHAIPDCFRHLMHDQRSQIIDFYPTNFHTDVKGKRYAWMGEVILPFIDEDRLLKQVSKYEHFLTPEEKERNTTYYNSIIYMNSNSSFSKILYKQEQNPIEFIKVFASTSLNQKENQLAGTIERHPKEISYNEKINVSNPDYNLTETLANQVFQFKYINVPETIVNPNLLPGVVLPPIELNPFALQQSDRRCFAGEKTIRVISRYLGINIQNNSYFQQNPEMIHNQHFNRDYAHNSFNEYYNNNRATNRDPTMFKSNQTLQRIMQKEQQMYQDKMHQPNDNIQIQQNQYGQQYAPPQQQQNQTFQQQQQKYLQSIRSSQFNQNYQKSENQGYFNNPNQNQESQNKQSQYQNRFENLEEDEDNYQDRQQYKNKQYYHKKNNYYNKNNNFRQNYQRGQDNGYKRSYISDNQPYQMSRPDYKKYPDQQIPQQPQQQYQQNYKQYQYNKQQNYDQNYQNKQYYHQKNRDNNYYDNDRSNFVQKRQQGYNNDNQEYHIKKKQFNDNDNQYNRNQYNNQDNQYNRKNNY